MAQHYNISLEEVQRIYSVDGQSLRFVVGDLNNGGNGSSQIIYTVPQNNPPAIYPQTINLATQLDQRQSVYIIKTSDSPGTQNIIKANTVATHLVTENVNFVEAKDSKATVNNVQEAQQAQWINVQDKISYESVLKQSTSLKTQPKLQQQNNLQTVVLQTQGHCSQPELQVYGSMEKKNQRFISAKGKSPLSSSSSSSSSLGQTPRNQSENVTRFISPPTATVRGRLSNEPITTTQQIVRTIRPQQQNTIMNSNQQRNSPHILQRNLNRNLNSGDIAHLSERIKREKLNQLKQDQVHNEKQAIYRNVGQKTPIITQRPIGTARPLQYRQQQQQQNSMRVQTPTRPMQQQRMMTPVMSPVKGEQRRIVVNSPPRQRTPIRGNLQQQQQQQQNEQIIQQEIGERRMTQQSCTPKSDSSEQNSSESYAYLQRVIADPHTAIVQHQITGNVAKMLVVLLDGEQRLITFDIPIEECTVQDLLEQVNVPFGSENTVSLVNDPTLGINYIVEVQPPSESSSDQNDSQKRTQELPKNCIRNPSPTMSLQFDENSNSSTSQIEEPKYVEGKVAVCPYCGVLSSTFNQCERCKRKMPDNVKSVSDTRGNKDAKDSLPYDNFYKKVDMTPSKGEKLEREATPARGRGRGRGGARGRKPIKEPECLIISSDEEHENEKTVKKEGASRIFSGINEGMNMEESEMILEKEPVITNQSANASEGIKGTERDSDDQITECPTNTIHTLLHCRTVRIGSYKYVPVENVIISERGLRLNVPFLEDHKKLVTVDVKFKHIVRLLVHFGKAMPVLFFYTTTATGVMIRDVLGMQDPKGPYFDPASKDHTHKRITLLPDRINEESKSILKTLYEGKLEELSPKEANDILVRASPKDCIQQVLSRRSSNQTSSSHANTNANGVIQTITTYPPPPAKGGIAINTEDYICLGEDQFLNDVIIDFYLKYLTSEILSEEDRNRTHVFSSYFYKRLTSPHASAAMDSNMPQTAAGKRHARVQKWTKNVNIFEKDFIVIPINEHAHWFLAIICFPGLVGKILTKSASEKEAAEQKNNVHRSKRLKEVKLQSMQIGNTTITPVTTTITIDQGDDGSERDEAEGDDEEMEMDSEDDDEMEEDANLKEQQASQEKTEKLPCILIFDSLAGASRCRVVATLRDYLFCEHIAKMGSEKVFSKDTIKGASPKVPQQSNFIDCGVYVLQYVESFFKDPIKDYTLPIKILRNWFEEIVVTRKREEISKLLIELMKKTSKGDKLISLPSVSFPTQDGKLKPKLESEKSEKGEKTITTTTSTTSAAATTTATTTTTPTLGKSDEGKRKIENEGKTSATANIENAESSSEITKKISLIPYSSTSSSSCSSTEGNVSDILTDISQVKSSAETMNYLKSKRIQRIIMKSDNSDDKPAAKKLKSDNGDACK
ncbi:uncharacterized protein LOC122504870 isoform X2 [Leptopilina heterotoma]|uniref:uncharacterized protein LOC122504870 isoform X2 n=1 Tax=Leptopilina heterotoma TaxID=63436 RepID=UPI001CA84302|nr:uncharacterized protein LOC122504870 isoform X2 [Leptopilina heterotoma]